jgi:hypothetical protein
MHPLTPASLARRLGNALVAVALLASCNHDGPTDPLSRVHALRPVDNLIQIKAGTEGALLVVVLDADGRPVPNVDVAWEATSGVLVTTTSLSGIDGVAGNRLTAPPELGTVAVTARAGSVSLQLAVSVVPGPVAKLDILEDSIRFTAQLQMRTVHVLGFDQFGHQLSLGTNVVQSGASYSQVRSVAAAGDTAVVAVSSGFGTSRGYLVLATQDGRARDSVLAVLDPVPVRTEISGLDSANGLAVGERARLKVTGVDSLGFTIFNVDSARSKLQLSTSDPSVATVADDGTVTAIAPGTVTIGASAVGTSYRQDLTVYPVFDVGTRKAGIGLRDQQAYVQFPVDQLLTDAGTLYELETLSSHTATSTALRAHATDGKVAWVRSYPGYGDAVADPASGVVYMIDDVHMVHAIDPAGTDRWAFDYGAFSTGGCQLATWRTGVAAACGTHAFALNVDRSLAWSATVDDTVRQVITTPVLAVVRMKNAVSALRDDGTVAWTRSLSAGDMIANAASTVYLVANGVHAIDSDGTERWYNPTPLGGCILATTERLVVCRNISVITALDPTDGHVRWTISSPASFGTMAAISGDRLLVSDAFLFAFDARTGAVLGRSFGRLDEYYLSVGHGVMAATSVDFAQVFSTSFSPGSEWAQNAGDAGHGNRVTP